MSLLCYQFLWNCNMATCWSLEFLTIHNILHRSELRHLLWFSWSVKVKVGMTFLYWVAATKGADHWRGVNHDINETLLDLLKIAQELVCHLCCKFWIAYSWWFEQCWKVVFESLKPIGVGFHVPSLGWSCHFQEVGHSSGKLMWQMKDNGVCSSKNIPPKAMFTSSSSSP